jgi:hypothetical protein
VQDRNEGRGEKEGELEGFCFEKERGGKPRERESDSFFF